MRTQAGILSMDQKGERNSSRKTSVEKVVHLPNSHSFVTASFLLVYHLTSQVIACHV